MKGIVREARGFRPKIAENVFIAENAAVIGQVQIGRDSSVWYNVSIRGDVMPILIGEMTNIQDKTVLHGSLDEYGCSVGHRVTVGHSVILHGCTIQDECLIGMGSVIMDGVEIGTQSLVAAGSLITEGKKFPPRSLIMGRPAVAKRTLTDQEVKDIQTSAEHYLMYTSWYK